MVEYTAGTTIRNCTLDGKHVAYHAETEFLVQVRKNGKYLTKYRIKGNLPQAVMWFNGINVGNGWRKRLYAPSMNKPTLAFVKG